MMDSLKLIDELLSFPHETEWIEFKTNYWDFKGIGEYISALSNSAAILGKKYGYLVWGVANDNHEVLGTNIDKGAIFENIIADAFTKLGKKLYYFNKNNGLGIDFITNYNNELTLIEVKANNGNAKSLKEVLNNKTKYNVNRAIKLIDGNIGETKKIYTIPLYMAFLLN